MTFTYDEIDMITSAIEVFMEYDLPGTNPAIRDRLCGILNECIRKFENFNERTSFTKVEGALTLEAFCWICESYDKLPRKHAALQRKLKQLFDAAV